MSAKGTHDVKRLRIGMYQRYLGGNMDEGWTRWLLERFAFPYTSLFDAEIKNGGLHENYDVIILPNDSHGHDYRRPRSLVRRREGGRTQQQVATGVLSARSTAVASAMRGSRHWRSLSSRAGPC